MNTKDTAETILEMAETMDRYARQLERCADKLDKTGEFEYAAEALSTVINCLGNLRLDLLVTRPIREYQRELQL